MLRVMQKRTKSEYEKNIYDIRVIEFYNISDMYVSSFNINKNI